MLGGAKTGEKLISKEMEAEKNEVWRSEQKNELRHGRIERLIHKGTEGLNRRRKERPIERKLAS